MADVKEELLIRKLLIGGGAVVGCGIFGLALVVTVLLSLNFNILRWLE